MMQEDKLHYEDFTEGRSFALGPRLVTAEEIIDFAREFDPQPMHLSEEAGRPAFSAACPPPAGTHQASSCA